MTRKKKSHTPYIDEDGYEVVDVPSPKQSSLFSRGRDDDWGYDPSISYGSAAAQSKWGSWGTTWKSTYNFDTIESLRKRKKKIESDMQDFKAKHSIIAKTYIGTETTISRKKGGIYNLGINNTENYKDDIKLLEAAVNLWKRLPGSNKVAMNSNLLSTLITHHISGNLLTLFQNTQLAKDGKMKEIQEIIDKVASTFNKPVIDDNDVDMLLNAIPEKIKDELEEHDGHGGISSLVESWAPIPRQGKKLRVAQPVNRFVKFPHLTKGKRINKKFIQKMDYKPLQRKEKILTRKRKILFLLDGSGSMSHGPYDAGVNFMSQVMALNMFDIAAYHTSDRRVTDVTIALRNWTDQQGKGRKKDNFIAIDGSEGFELLTTRLGNITRDEDYVIVITDMNVPQNAERNLKEFIGNKKHMILSFAGKGTFGCNVRQVKKYEDMANVITSLLSH